MAFQWLGVYDVIGMPFWIFLLYQKSPNWMILISINFHFLCFSEYKTMLVQAGSFWILFSLFKTVVYYYLGIIFSTEAIPSKLDYEKIKSM